MESLLLTLFDIDVKQRKRQGIPPSKQWAIAIVIYWV
jgi:hypothetical protein